MIRLLRLLLTLYVAIILQTVVAPWIEILGVRPDFPLVLVILVALKEGPAGGALAGFLTGLFVDASSAHALGVTSLANSLVGFVVGSTADRLVREGLLTRVLVTFLATFLRDQALVLLLPPHGFVDFFFQLARSSLPGGLYTAALAPLAMAAAERVIRWDREKSRALV